MPIDLQSFHEYCLTKREVTAEYPFGPGALVFKVAGKMFALVSEDARPLRVNLKCDPDDSLALRAQYPAITPGYHMDKRHWISLYLDGNLPDDLIYELVDDSYWLVVGGLKKVDRERLRRGTKKT